MARRHPIFGQIKPVIFDRSDGFSRRRNMTGVALRSYANIVNDGRARRN
jgi:hypothetical protein